LNKSKLNYSRNNSFGRTSNNLSIHQQNLEIDDVLSNVQSSNKNFKSFSPLKIVNIDANKHLMLPQSIVERYFSEPASIETVDKNLLPDAFESINKSCKIKCKNLQYNFQRKNSNECVII